MICRLLVCFDIAVGGEGGIRTLGTVSRTTVFETVPFNHSGTSPVAAKIKLPQWCRSFYKEIFKRLFETQRFNRIQFRRFVRRIKSGDKSNKNTNYKSYQDPYPWNKIRRASQKTCKEITGNNT